MRKLEGEIKREGGRGLGGEEGGAREANLIGVLLTAHKDEVF